MKKMHFFLLFWGSVYLIGFANKEDKATQIPTVISDRFPSLSAKIDAFAKEGLSKETPSANMEAIISFAHNFLNVPHKMGGETKKGFDCSGLLRKVFSLEGVDLPHSSQEIARYGKLVNTIDELAKGDLVFFVNTCTSEKLITHSGIFLGDGNFIHVSTKKGVTMTSLERSNYWRKRFLFGKRWE